MKHPAPQRIDERTVEYFKEICFSGMKHPVPQRIDERTFEYFKEIYFPG
jgi:hypothetical protein